MTFSIEVAGARTSAILYRAEGARASVLLAHGAGGRQTHPWMVAIARALAARGLDVVTFNFLYAEAARRVPDRNDVLEATWRAAIAAVRARDDVCHGRLFIGGKSMGGRIATQIAAQHGFEIAGVVLFGYPLHPPGNPAKLRVSHLASVDVPMLFVQGSRDAFGTPAELAPFVAGLREASVFVVEGGDHSLTPRTKGGVGVEAVIDRVADEVLRFTASR